MHYAAKDVKDMDSYGQQMGYCSQSNDDYDGAAAVQQLTELFHVACVAAQEGRVGLVPGEYNVALHLHTTK